MKLCFFGKLPIHADFLKWNANSQEFLALDQWVQKGISLARQKWSAQWEEKFDTSANYKFIYQPDNIKRLISGVFMSGKDKGGRRFPFIIFTELPTADFSNAADLISEIELKFLSDADNFMQNNWTDLDGVSFLNRFKNWIPKAEQALALDLSVKMTSSFWSDLFGTGSSNDKYLLIQNLIDTFLPFKKNQPSSAFPGVKIPLPIKKNERVPHITFWLKLIQKISPLETVNPTLFWDSGEKNNSLPFLYLYLKEPNPKNFLSFISPVEQIDNLPGNLAEIRKTKIDEIIKKITPSVRSLIDEELSMANFISRFMRG